MLLMQQSIRFNLVYRGALIWCTKIWILLHNLFGPDMHHVCYAERLFVKRALVPQKRFFFARNIWLWANNMVVFNLPIPLCIDFVDFAYFFTILDISKQKFELWAWVLVIHIHKRLWTLCIAHAQITWILC